MGIVNAKELPLKSMLALFEVNTNIGRCITLTIGFSIVEKSTLRLFLTVFRLTIEQLIYLCTQTIDSYRLRVSQICQRGPSAASQRLRATLEIGKQ